MGTVVFTWITAPASLSSRISGADVVAGLPVLEEKPSVVSYPAMSIQSLMLTTTPDRVPDRLDMLLSALSINISLRQFVASCASRARLPYACKTASGDMVCALHSEATWESERERIFWSSSVSGSEYIGGRAFRLSFSSFCFRRLLGTHYRRNEPFSTEEDDHRHEKTDQSLR